jgi:hypothetical protein
LELLLSKICEETQPIEQPVVPLTAWLLGIGVGAGGELG